VLTGLDARDLVDSSRAGGGVGVGHRRAVWMDGRQAWINWWGGCLGRRALLPVSHRHLCKCDNLDMIWG